MSLKQNTKAKDMINAISDICKKICKDMLKEKNVESISYATITAVNANDRYDVMVVGGTDEYKNLLNKSVSTPLSVGDNVILRYVQGNIGNGYISEKMGVDNRGGSSSTVTSVDGLTGDVVLNDVKYITQTLTSAQQEVARANIGAGTSSVTKTSELTNDSGFITALQAPVQSVNSLTGAVSLTTDTVPATTTNRYVPSVPTTNPATSYLNGNGVFETIAVGGASSVANIFLSNTASSVSGYKTLNYVADSTTTEMSVTCTSSADVLSATYLYSAPLGTTVIDAGIWKSTFYLKSSANAGTNRIKFVCFVRHTDGTETDLFTNYSSSVAQTTYGYFYTETSRQQFTVLATDTLGFRIYGNTDRTASTTIYYQIGGSNSSYFNSPLVLRHNQLRDLNGDTNYQHVTTAQIATFNGKQDALTFDTTPTSGSANPVTSGGIYSAFTNAVTGSSPITTSKSGIVTTVQHATSGVTAATYGDSGAQTPAFGGTFNVPTFVVNATGHITTASTHTVTIPATLATTTTAGLMSAADKSYLSGLINMATTTGTIDTTTTSATIATASGAMIVNTIAMQGDEEVMVDISIATDGTGTVTASVASAPTTAITITVIYIYTEA